MAAHLKQTGVILIDRDKFDYYSPDKQAVLRFEFPQTCVRDLELINRQEFENKLNSFIDSNKLNPTGLIIVLSDNILFKKSLTHISGNEKDDEIARFLETVPFNEIFSTVLNFEKDIQVIAANKDFCEIIKKTFEKKGIKINFIFPIGALSQIINNPQIILNPEIAIGIIKHIDMIKQGNFLESQKDVNTIDKNQLSEVQKKKKSPLLLILLPVFFLLILVLIFMILGNKPQTQNKNNYIAQNIIPTIIPTLVPTLIEIMPTSTPSAIIETDNLKVKILSNPKLATQEGQLQKSLISAGFKNIKTEENLSVNTQKNIILFSKLVQDNMRDILIEKVQSLIGEVSIQTNNDPAYDIIIILSQGF